MTFLSFTTSSPFTGFDTSLDDALVFFLKAVHPKMEFPVMLFPFPLLPIRSKLMSRWRDGGKGLVSHRLRRGEGLMSGRLGLGKGL